VWTYAQPMRFWKNESGCARAKTQRTFSYTLVREAVPSKWTEALVNYRDFHSLTHAGDWRMNITPVEHGVEVLAFDARCRFT